MTNQNYGTDFILAITMVSQRVVDDIETCEREREGASERARERESERARRERGESEERARRERGVREE